MNWDDKVKLQQLCLSYLHGFDKYQEMMRFILDNLFIFDYKDFTILINSIDLGSLMMDIETDKEDWGVIVEAYNLVEEEEDKSDLLVSLRFEVLNELTK